VAGQSGGEKTVAKGQYAREKLKFANEKRVFAIK
jgi:hypothetical protein